MIKKTLCLIIAACLVLAVPALAADTPALRTSEAGIAFIKDKEGFAATAYEDSLGWAIGYGTRCEPGEYPNGITEAEAKERGIPAVVGKCTMFGNARTVIEDPGRCFMKIVAHAETHEILGASLMCQHASDMISQISAAMVNHQTAEELRRVMRPHPSFEEAMTEALDALASKLA